MGDPDESWVPTDLAFSWRLLHQNGARAPTVEPNPMKYTMQILEAAAECEARSWRLAPIRSRDSHSLWAKLGGKVNAPRPLRSSRCSGRSLGEFLRPPVRVPPL
jgi:hypothetical protein